jgi:hypothetical protein
VSVASNVTPSHGSAAVVVGASVLSAAVSSVDADVSVPAASVESVLASVVGAAVVGAAVVGTVAAEVDEPEESESLPHAAIVIESAQNAPIHLSLDTSNPPVAERGNPARSIVCLLVARKRLFSRGPDQPSWLTRPTRLRSLSRMNAT